MFFTPGWMHHFIIGYEIKRKRKRSDSILWQKPQHQQNKSKKQRDNTKTPPKTSITQRLRTDLGRSVGVTTATQLVYLNQFTGSQPFHSPQQLYNRGHEHADIILQWAESWIHDIVQVQMHVINPY